MGITTTQKMGVAAVIMAASVFLSRIMGLVRDKVVSWQFGAGAESDVYFAAFVIPDFINHLLAGGYVAITLIPLLTAAFEDDERDGWRFFGSVVSWAFVLSVVLTYAAFLCAPMLAPLVAPGFSETQTARLVLFLRIILPAQIFFVTGSCLTAVLYIRRQFVVPALTPLIYNGAIIAGGLLVPGQGMEGYCWGVLVGAGIGAFLLPLAAVLRGGFVLIPGFRHARLWKLVLLALPLMLGLSVTVMDEQLIRIFGSMAGEGAVSLLNYARRIMMLPVGVVAQAAGVASFPFLAALMAKGDSEGFGATVNRALRGSMYVVIPLTMCMIAVAQPTLGVLFEGGRFSSAETELAAPLLRVMLLSVPFWTVHQVVNRAFYARQDTLTPAVVGTLTTAAVCAAYPFVVRTYGAAGVAACAAGSIAVYTAVLCLVWERRLGGRIFDGLFAVIGRPMTLGAVSCVTACGAIDYAAPKAAFFAGELSSVLPVSSALAEHACNGAFGCAVFVCCYVLSGSYCCPEVLPPWLNLKKGVERCIRRF